MARVVCDTETSRLGMLVNSALTRDVLPAPLGADMTYSWPDVCSILFKVLHLFPHLFNQHFELYGGVARRE
jgi:hypothetical protein